MRRLPPAVLLPDVAFANPLAPSGALAQAPTGLLVLDASGFVRRSQVFAGNVREHYTLVALSRCRAFTAPSQRCRPCVFNDLRNLRGLSSLTTAGSWREIARRGRQMEGWWAGWNRAALRFVAPRHVRCPSSAFARTVVRLTVDVLLDGRRSQRCRPTRTQRACYAERAS